MVSKAQELDVPELEGWMILTDAAALLGVSRQSVHRMVRTGRIKTCHKLGERPLYIVRKAEVLQISREQGDTIRKHQARQLKQDTSDEGH